MKSFNRFYAFIAQIISLEDTSLEKLASYGGWLSRLLPNRELPPEIEITEEMLRLQAFKVDKKEQGSASLSPGDTQPLAAISEFGAKPYTEDEKKELSEIIKSFNDRHGTQFTEAQMARIEAVNPEIVDDNMREMLRNNPPDVVRSAYDQAVFQGMIRMFQNDAEMRDIILTDPEIRNKVTSYLFGRALRDAQRVA